MACSSTPKSPFGSSPGGIHQNARLNARARFFDAQGNERTLPSILDELAQADVVFFGETHTDDTTHELEHAVLTGLAKRRKDQVTLSLERSEERRGGKEC